MFSLFMIKQTHGRCYIRSISIKGQRKMKNRMFVHDSYGTLVMIIELSVAAYKNAD